jgi:hypothetical protein
LQACKCSSFKRQTFQNQQGAMGEVSFTKKNRVKEAATTVAEEAKPQMGLLALDVQQILTLTPKSYEELTGKKMSFRDKLALKFVQRNIKKDLKKNGTVNLPDYVDEDGSTRFNIGGFALGLLLGFIGVALAHIFSNSKSFRRSSWYGLGAIIIIALVITLAGGGH